MSEVTREKAVARLAKAIKPLPPDELAEIYNELFPSMPISEEVVRQDPTEHLSSVLTYIDRGLEAEEIVDLWDVVFPADRNVYYDEESDRICFDEEAQIAR